MKYQLLKLLDVCGMTSLTPVVRLCYGDEPRLQLRKIGQCLVVPLLSVAAFLVLWSQIAPRHKTKSGEVPTPSVVWNATVGIWEFHQRENDKQDAYELTGDARIARLGEVEARLKVLETLTAEADRKVAVAEVKATQRTAELVSAVEQRVAAAEMKIRSQAYARAEAIRQLSVSLSAGNDESHSRLMSEVRADSVAAKAEAEKLKQTRSEVDDVRSQKHEALLLARNAQTSIADEKQYLLKVSDQLTKANRETKFTESQSKITADLAAFKTASGAEAVELAKKIALSEDRMESTAGSEYAKPWTLPDQIIRSLACVFFGFLLGSAIAIPVGVLCGLNPTFMSAMTPFIALFKPVSPIVWLPIALIIVGGFIPDPDKHWFISLLAEIPLLGRLKINPAFIASGVTVALCSLWPTLVNTALGVASIEKDHLNVARVLRLGFWSRMTKIVIPSALPLIFAGLRISLGVGWMVLIAAELLSSSEGLGKFIWDQFNNGASDSFAKMVAVVFVVGAIGLLLDRIMIILQRSVSFDGATAAM